MKDNNTGYMSRAEARSLAGGISKATEWRWYTSGRFPKPVRIGPAKTVYRRADVLAWAADPEAWAAVHGAEV